jgi:hypothetical protein
MPNRLVHLVAVVALLAGACSSKGPSPAAGDTASPASAPGKPAAAAPVAEVAKAPDAPAWERHDLSKLPHPVPATVETPPGVKIESSEVGHGAADGKTLPDFANAVDVRGQGWALRIEAASDATAASAADEKRNRNLTDDMVVATEAFDDGGWLLASKGSKGFWVYGARKQPKMICDSQGEVESMATLEELIKVCRSIRASGAP